MGTLILIIGMPAAFAAPGGTQKTKSGPTHTHTPQAAANATRGMNRVGSPGTWKSHGHVPASVSTPQGYSPSDPDANGNGGADKPGAVGGFNDDRDGNNGCG